MLKFHSFFAINNSINKITAIPIPNIEKVETGVAVMLTPKFKRPVFKTVARIIFATNAKIITNAKMIINGLSFLIATIFYHLVLRHSPIKYIKYHFWEENIMY